MSLPIHRNSSLANTTQLWHRMDSEERFKQHCDGAQNKHGRLYAGVVKQHGVKLRPDLAPRKKYFDQASAKRGEKEHFELLKSRGFNVKGGH